jgi:hypothetical protein
MREDVDNVDGGVGPTQTRLQPETRPEEATDGTK